MAFGRREMHFGKMCHAAGIGEKEKGLPHSGSRPLKKSAITQKRNTPAFFTEVFQLELMTRIELVNLILTKDALYRLSYISAATKCILTDLVRFCKPFCQIF